VVRQKQIETYELTGLGNFVGCLVTTVTAFADWTNLLQPSSDGLPEGLPARLKPQTYELYS
jgi:hypothetical protein